MNDHPADDLLERFAHSAAGVQDPVGAHVQTCERCTEIVATTLLLEAELRHPETWAARNVDAPSFSLAGTEAMALHVEDAVAEYALRPLLEDPAELESLPAHPRYRTAGVVRLLNAESRLVRETAPSHALILANAAIRIAEQLTPATYDVALCASLSGDAWRERANALRYLGEYDKALLAVDHAERAFRATPVREFDLARIDYARSTILWKMERWNEALPLARAAAATFREFGDAQRTIDAGLLEGGILFELGEYPAALEAFQKLEVLAAELDDPATKARVASNLGATYQELGELERCAPFFAEAAVLYEFLGMELEKLRTEWSIGLIALRAPSSVAQGVASLRRVCGGFEARGSMTDAALVALDLAEHFLRAGETDEVTALCGALAQRFTRAGMRSSAATALEFLGEAAAAERARPTDVDYVRSFLARITADPETRFQPPLA